MSHFRSEDRGSWVSPAVRGRDHVFVTATAPIWPDGSCNPDSGARARRCLEIIVAGAGPGPVVRTRTYVVDRADGETVM
jgi:hypothetical protein